MFAPSGELLFSQAGFIEFILESRQATVLFPQFSNICLPLEAGGQSFVYFSNALQNRGRLAIIPAPPVSDKIFNLPVVDLDGCLGIFRFSGTGNCEIVATPALAREQLERPAHLPLV